MARRVVSLIGGPGAALQASDAAVEANAFAIAEDVELSLVLRGDGVELCVAGGEVPPAEIAGVPLPPAAVAQDLRGLLESGVAVYAEAGALRSRGLGATDLIDGVHVLDAAALADVLGAAEAVLAW